MDIKQIQDLIKFVSKSGVREVEIEQKDFKLQIKNNIEKEGSVSAGDLMKLLMKQQPMQVTTSAAPQASAPAPQPAQAPTAKEEPTPEAPKENNEKYKTVKASMIGTFYRSPSPDKPPFVKVGDTVEKGQTLCIIEAMKLFNEIEAEFSGKVVKVLPEDASPVQYDQPLFVIDPA